MLRVSDLSVSFGGVQAVRNVNFEVGLGSVHGLIGPNGAGKSTTIEAISGFVRARGSVRLDGTELVGHRPAYATQKGLARTFQQAQLWGGLPVRLNVSLAARISDRSPVIETLLERLGLATLRDVYAIDLPYGTRRLVEVARAIACDPKVLLLDEPGAGLTATERDLLVDVITELREQGKSILLVDHDIALIRAVSHEVTVMDAGAVIASGDPEAVFGDPRVIETYLGREE